MMKNIKSVALLCSLLGLTGVGATPSVEDLDSALTILRDNDLYGQDTTRTSDGILVEVGKSFQAAKKICSSLGESLWSPKAEDFAAGLNNTLSYQEYLGKFPHGQQFWVGSTGAACQAIDVKGRSHSLDCNLKLPAICTQSAPLSNLSLVDTSPKFYISKKVGAQTVTGYRDANSWRFMGVRFSPNVKRFAYSSVYNGQGSAMAVDVPPDCLQNIGGQATGSEDCLHLNLWTPYLPGKSIVKKDLKPVFFWIYGGGNTGGSSNDAGGDSGNFAARGDAVVVGINYRLGNLGWLAISDTDITGNYGLSDMVTGLQWVQKYIRYYGGDPNRVTIMGESAGAGNVRTLMASPAAKGLFHAAIMESQPIGYIPNRWYTEYRTIEETTTAFGAGVLADTNCTNARDKEACLRALDPSFIALLPVQANYPIMDGRYIISSALPVTGKGFLNSVPTLLGSNRDELGITLSQLLPPYTNFTESLAAISLLLTQDITAVANSPAFPLSPGDPAAAVFNASVRVLTDGALKCLTYSTAYSAAKHHTLPAVYAFEFNRTYSPAGFTSAACSPPITPSHPYGDPNQEYFKCHAGEVDYAFGVVLRTGLPQRDEFDIPFSQLVLDHWASFVWNHDPNPSTDYLKARGYYNTLNQVKISGLWERVNAARPQLKWLQWNSRTVPFPEGPQCAALGYPLDYFETYL
ncbi:hypothetical protein TWF694_000272 [Orbilia ellipsospora]|uniref:Carboxylesterase type B domain-containing protein n=1 Tax=Orbilia ellipsospora TaxID=2528407 RepID=A0AAV9XNK2_9PEZI